MTQIKFILLLSLLGSFLVACGDPVQLYKQQRQALLEPPPPPPQLENVDPNSFNQTPIQAVANRCSAYGVNFVEQPDPNNIDGYLCVETVRECTDKVNRAVRVSFQRVADLSTLTQQYRYDDNCNPCDRCTPTRGCDDTTDLTYRKVAARNATGCESDCSQQQTGCETSNPCDPNTLAQAPTHAPTTLSFSKRIELTEAVTTDNQKYTLNLLFILSHWIEEETSELRYVRGSLVNALVNLFNDIRSNYPSVRPRFIFTSTYLEDYPDLIGKPWDIYYDNGRATPIVENRTIDSIQRSNENLFDVFNENLYGMTFCVQCEEDNPLVALIESLTSNRNIFKTGDLAIVIVTPTDEYAQKNGNITTPEDITNHFNTLKSNNPTDWGNKLITMNGIIYQSNDDFECENKLVDIYGDYDYRPSEKIEKVISNFRGSTTSICNFGNYYSEALDFRNRILHPDANPNGFKLKVDIEKTHQITPDTITVKASTPDGRNSQTLLHNKLNFTQNETGQYIEVPYVELPIGTSSITLEYSYTEQNEPEQEVNS